jgi:hypothetical protein
MRMILLGLLVAGCSHLGYSQPTCSDPSCQAVAKHLATIEEQHADWCGTIRARAFLAIVRMGELAVPALQAELDGDSLGRVRTAVDALIELGHSKEVAAWCLSLPQDERGLACVDM